jgi:D-alanine-D-alanine ligase
VAVLFGGRSGEHEVSRNSAFSVAKALTGSFEVFPVGIAKDGQWCGPVKIDEIPVFTPEKYEKKAVTILPNPQSGGTIYSLPDLEPISRVHVFFPVLHGTFGEDGTVQGLLEMAEVPYVGGGVLASALGMDKLMMKAVFAHAGLPQVPYIGFLRKEIRERREEVIDKIENGLGYPCFVKPANLGSSVGISKAKNRNELDRALVLAAQYDRKVIVEKGVNAREIEISVLGNEDPLASIPGEIVPCNEFYDYNAKYVDDRSELHIPARLSDDQVKMIQEIALAAYKAIDCAGLARIDFFIVKDTGQILINEINTMPGFTSISMYPKMWEHAGIPMGELVKRLVELALERREEAKLSVRTYTG